MGRLEELESFIDVVKLGGISRAAEKQGVAKSAVSRRLAELEHRLGTQLIFRTTRKMSLTESGRQLYAQAVEIVADLNNVENEVVDETAELTGVIRLALPLSFGISKMSEPIAKFHQLHPKIELDVDLNDRRTDLVREGYDLAIRIGDLDDSSMRARYLFPCRRYICGNRNYIESIGWPKDVDELEKFDAALYATNKGARWEFNGDNGIESVRVNNRVTSNNGDFLVQYAKQNDVLVRMPSFLVDEAIHNKELEVVLPEKKVMHLDVWVVYPDTRHLSNRVRHFIDFIADYFANGPEWEKDLP